MSPEGEGVPFQQPITRGWWRCFFVCSFCLGAEHQKPPLLGYWHSSVVEPWKWLQSEHHGLFKSCRTVQSMRMRGLVGGRVCSCVQLWDGPGVDPEKLNMQIFWRIAKDEQCVRSLISWLEVYQLRPLAAFTGKCLVFSHCVWIEWFALLQCFSGVMMHKLSQTSRRSEGVQQPVSTLLSCPWSTRYEPTLYRLCLYISTAGKIAFTGSLFLSY